LDQVKEVFFKLKEKGFYWDENVGFISDESFTSFIVRWEKSDAVLKLDFVNDVAAHFGDIIQTDVYYRTDSIRNILSNKLSALFRFDAKDVADIREIALHETINWPQVIREARQKEAGIEPISLSEILTGIPRNEFETIAWIQKPDWNEFYADINKIAFDMLNG